MCTGWSWEYIEENMTIPRLDAFTHYWKDNPPLHVMVAAYFGIGKKEKPKPPTENEIAAFLSTIPKRPEP